MTDHKFTDDDVIKALECCSKDVPIRNSCEGCPFAGKKCAAFLPQTALDLINRQKAEIESLKDGWDYIPANAAQALKEHAVAEAIKEFAERFKEIDVETFEEYDKWGLTYVSEERIHNAIDSLVKATTEETK